MSEKKQHGGCRAGAGRPIELKNPKRVIIRLEADQLDWIKSQGTITNVIRNLITIAMNKDKTK